MKRTRLAIERLESRALLSGIPELVHVQSIDGLGSSYPSYGNFHRFTAVDDMLYYVSGSYVEAGFPQYTWNLWANDGTPGGPRGVIYGPSGTFTAESPDWLAAAGNNLFFASKIHPSYLEVSYGLWVSDGTEEGTVLVHEVPEPEGNLPPQWPTEFDGRLFFVSETREHGHELWVSDGTPEGTSMLKDIATGVDSSDPSHLLVFDGNLFFMADDGGGTKEIWQSDGTPENTSPIEDTYDASEIRNRMASLEPYPARKSSIVVGDKHFTSSGDCIWVEPVDGSTGEEPEEAPVRLFASRLGPSLIGSTNEIVYFFFKEYVNSPEATSWNLYTIDGESISRVHRGMGGYSVLPKNVTSIEDKLFFAIQDYSPGNLTGVELWVSDGTEAGTHIVKDINPGREDSNPRYLSNIDGLLYFVADDPDGPGLWRTDGTADGTVRVDDPAYASSLHSAGREVYFVADTRDPTVGRELYTSLNPEFEAEYSEYNGFLIKDIRSGPSGSNPSEFMFVPEGERIIDGVPHFGTLYFTADDGTNRRQLWKSDWTDEGTIKLSQYQFRLSEVRVGDRVYSTDSCAVWLTDRDGTFNNHPSIDVPDDIMMTPGTGTYLPGFQVSDGDFIGSDADTVPIQVGIRANRGRLTIDGTGLSSVSGSHTSDLVIEGTLNAVNQALSSLRYASDESFIGTDVITAEVNDLGHFGEGGPLTAQNEMNIAIDRIRLPGDTDFDGDVDLVDFSRLKRRFGSSPAAWNQGDFNGDNRVDLHDFNLLKANFSSSEAALALAVDEIMEDVTY